MRSNRKSNVCTLRKSIVAGYCLICSFSCTEFVVLYYRLRRWDSFSSDRTLNQGSVPNTCIDVFARYFVLGLHYALNIIQSNLPTTIHFVSDSKCYQEITFVLRCCLYRDVILSLYRGLTILCKILFFRIKKWILYFSINFWTIYLLVLFTFLKNPLTT